MESGSVCIGLWPGADAEGFLCGGAQGVSLQQTVSESPDYYPVYPGHPGSYSCNLLQQVAAGVTAGCEASCYLHAPSAECCVATVPVGKFPRDSGALPVAKFPRYLGALPSSRRMSPTM
eukprot:365355-Chlamydomonas_euryale.AAC.2